MLLNSLAKSNSKIFPSSEKYSNSKVSDKIKELSDTLIILNNDVMIWNLFVAYPKMSSLQSNVQS